MQAEARRGAVLDLLFGVTGILLNHRTIMEIPIEKIVRKAVIAGSKHGK